MQPLPQSKGVLTNVDSVFMAHKRAASSIRKPAPVTIATFERAASICKDARVIRLHRCSVAYGWSATTGLRRKPPRDKHGSRRRWCGISGSS